MQHSTLSEAEQLIQSWLQVKPDPEIASDLPSSTFDEYRHVSHWSGMETESLSSHSVPQLASFHGHTPYSGSQYPTLPPSTSILSYTPLIPPSSHAPYTTDDWRRNLSLKSDTWTSLKHSQKKRPKPHTLLSTKWCQNLNLNPDKSSSSRVEGGDVLSGQDWGEEGEVRESVSSIMRTLMEKPVASLGGEGEIPGERKRGQHDPRVTMDMRHSQVRERRRARDEARHRDVRKRRQQKEAWQEAERLVREGEREEGRRRRREERLVAEQMETIRRQVQTETDRKRRDCSRGVSSVKPHPSVVLGLSEREAVMVSGGECVKEEARERRKRENREELVRQLEEATLSDKKERLKVLRHSVSVWYGVVTEQRAKVCRASAWRAWHLMGRVWGVWRGYVRERRERREGERVTREMQREKRLVLMARRHYHHRLLRRCVGGWMVEVGRERGRREREEEGRRHRDRMVAFLTAAETTSSTVSREEREREGERVGETDETLVGCDREAVKERGGPPSEKKATPQPTMWQTARKHVDELLSTVAPPPINKEEEKSREKDHTPKSTQSQSASGVSEKTMSKRGTATAAAAVEEVVARTRRSREDSKPINSPPVWPARPQPKPVTKPIPMSGMHVRAEEIAERRKRREERERERAREREERERREEEERREREQQEREALTARRREERRLAKQKEMEKLERQRREKDQLSLSLAHYRSHLLQTRGLRPWLRFMESMREDRRRADNFNLNWRMQCSFHKWRCIVDGRFDQRRQAADDLHHVILKRRVWQGWREYVDECRCMEAACEGLSRELLSRAVFRAWVRAAATARREGWERERRAKMHHVRQLKRRVLLSWQCYVPLSREEREREVRRAGLRRKVTQWLPDYQPRDFDQENIIL